MNYTGNNMHQVKDIAEIFLSIKNIDDMTEFLNEILTDNEKKDLALRWELLERLYKGQPQRAIASELGISLCRITRGAKILKSGDSVTEKILRNMKNK